MGSAFFFCFFFFFLICCLVFLAFEVSSFFCLLREKKKGATKVKLYSFRVRGFPPMGISPREDLPRRKNPQRQLLREKRNKGNPLRGEESTSERDLVEKGV
jgi:hypothetical protein